MQVLYYPLDNYGHPQTTKSYSGRFVFKSSEFLDPAVYKKDTEITVAGTLIGDLDRTVGKKTLRLPLLIATTLYLWPQYDRSNYYDNFNYGHGYYGAYPYYWGNYYWPPRPYFYPR